MIKLIILLSKNIIVMGVFLKFKILFVCLSLLGLLGCSKKQNIADVNDFYHYVNPFIGTLHEGHCFPGATVPMGMVQLSPQTTTEYYNGYEMDHCIGYQYTDSLMLGFAHTHLNGPGCPSFADILVMPFCNRNIDYSNNEPFASTYDKKSELAYPGYYKVSLLKNNVDVELTASEHVGYHRYNYNSLNQTGLLLDFQHGLSWNKSTNYNVVIDAENYREGDMIVGWRHTKEWASEKKIYYAIKFNKKILDYKELPVRNINEKGKRYLLNFDFNEDKVLEVVVGISGTSIQAAKANLNHEFSSWDTFDEFKKNAIDKWNRIFSIIDIEGDNENKTAFYTAFYHLYMQPHNIADVSGEYRGEKDSIYLAKSGRFYSTFSLWDTFRAAHPLYTILTPAVVGDFVSSLLESYQNKSVADADNKYLPRWGLWGKETNTMVGNHAIPVIVDAWLKGIRPTGFSDEEIYQAIKNSALLPHYRTHTELINKFGYIPYDISISKFDDRRETVSRLLENIFDDYCVGIMAAKLGYEDDREFFFNRSKYYMNVYDKISGFMLGKDSSGRFKQVFDPKEVVGEWLHESDYTEGNSWHYLFHVLHDVYGMINLMGGEEAFELKLDSMFYSKSSPEVKTLVWNIYGTLGQYWHGNEPCHHVPYLYKYTEGKHKADAIINYIVDNFYKNKPNGLVGNDDCGQMSAWYMFSSLGFYPVNPVDGRFILGAPQNEYSKIKLRNGNAFCIYAHDISDENIFVKSVKLNGKTLDRNYITYDEIMSGGKLEFYMYNREDLELLQNFYQPLKNN